ncbi:MAG: hypothetical protein MRY83_04890 [Flavobacteriales bacterium]|nr:hypothetical protein [Flavobacteriales bacterium]
MYLDLSFEIHNIQEIHNDESKRTKVYEAASKFLEAEGLLSKDLIIDFLGQQGFLAGYTTGPIHIDKPEEWMTDVTERWSKMATEILGDSCEPKVDFT